MSLTSLLMILAVASSPASEGRHVDAVEIFSYDFDSQADVDKNYDLWPDTWRRKIGPDWPHYVLAQLEDDEIQEQQQDDEAAEVDRCLTVRLNGGGALLMSPAMGVSNKFSYVVDARLRADKLKHGQARLRIDFCDDDQQRTILESVTSEWFGNTNGWVTAHIGPVSINHPDVQLAQITFEVARGKRVDLEGIVSLDDVWFARLPRMAVHTNSPFNVYTDPKDVIVTCDLSGILEQDPDIRFELLDASSERLQENTVQLEGRLITERLSKASDIINSSLERPKGYAGSTQWKPPIKEFGFYRVRVSMRSRGENVSIWKGSCRWMTSGSHACPAWRFTPTVRSTYIPTRRTLLSLAICRAFWNKIPTSASSCSTRVVIACRTTRCSSKAG